MGGDEAARFVVAPQAHGLEFRQRLAVDGDDIIWADVAGRTLQDLTVDRNAALCDPALGIAARAQPGPRNGLGDTHDTWAAAWLAAGCFGSSSFPGADGVWWADRRACSGTFAAFVVGARLGLTRSGFAHDVKLWVA